MKKFSKHWKGSKNPKKKRKYLANAPLHIKRRFLSVNLSKDLRKKQNRRNIPVVKNDIVKVTRGKFKGKKGKVLSIDTKRLRVEVEEVQTTKQDGSKINVLMEPSNLQITELHSEDKKRFGIKEIKKPEGKVEKEADNKKDKNKASKKSNQAKKKNRKNKK